MVLVFIFLWGVLLFKFKSAFCRMDDLLSQCKVTLKTSVLCLLCGFISAIWFDVPFGLFFYCLFFHGWHDIRLQKHLFCLVISSRLIAVMPSEPKSSVIPLNCFYPRILTRFLQSYLRVHFPSFWFRSDHSWIVIHEVQASYLNFYNFE